MRVFFRTPGRVVAFCLACAMSIVGPLLIIMTGSDIVGHESKRTVVDGWQGRSVLYIGAQTRVMYNRVGKCGSRATLTLLQAVASWNNITLVLSDIGNQKELSLPEQIDLVNYINQLPPPFVYSRHMHYIDFQRLGAVPLVHINIIRDPVSRFVSQFYFKRFGDGRDRDRSSIFHGKIHQTIDECVERNEDECTDPKKLFYIIPFFCGQEELCRVPGEWALEKAKSTVIEKYLFVGILEEYEDTLRVLEKLLPIHFRGIIDILHNPDPWTKQRLETLSTKSKIPPNERNKRILQFRLQLEYQFYYFVRERFHLLKHQLGIRQATKR